MTDTEEDEDKSHDHDFDNASFDETNFRSLGQGGLITGMIPTEGYCLVFEAETKWYKLKIQRDQLVLEKAGDISITEYNEGGWSDKFDEPYMKNLLYGFKDANIQYTMIRSKDRMKKYIYVIISCKKRIAQIWADKHNIDVRIDPEQAIKVGEQFEG